MKYAQMLRSQIADLESQRNAHLDDMDTIAVSIDADTARTSKAPTPDEEALLEVHRSAVAELDGKIADLEKRAKEIEEIERRRDVAPPQSKGQPVNKSSFYDIDLRSAPRSPEMVRDINERARRAVDAENLSADKRESIEYLFRRDRQGALARHIIATGRPEYRSAFVKLVTQNPPLLTLEEQRAVEEVRNLEITTDSSGGFLMPFTLDPTVMLTNAGTINPMRQLATVRTVLTDNWQGITSAGVTASWDAEAEEVSDDTPVFAQPAIPVRTPRAFLPYTLEAEDDLANLAEEAMTMIFDAKDRLEAAGFTTGTGLSNQPQGIVNGLVAGGSVVNSITTDTFAVGDLYAVNDALPARFEANATWQMNKSIISRTRQFGTSDGHTLLSRLGDGTPPQLMDGALFKNSDLDGVINATVDNYIVVYGDVRAAYRINDRIGVRIEPVPMLFGANRRPTGERGWYARWRVGAGVVNAAAARVLNVT